MQKSWQAVAGLIIILSVSITAHAVDAEAYYKGCTMWCLMILTMSSPLFRENSKSIAAGIEMRLHGELVPDAESWISLHHENIEDIEIIFQSV
jgi:hypothetical protein